jgi:integrase
VPAVSAFLSWLRNGCTTEHSLVEPEDAPSPETVAARLAAVVSFYRWQEAVFDVPVAGRLLRGAPSRWAPARGLLAHLDARTPARASSLVRVRRSRRRDRPPLLLPREIQAILDGCAVYDTATGQWKGNLRDRLLFAILAETGCRLGEVLGMRISDFVMGRGGTGYVEIVPRADNPNGARVKMMRPRRVYVGPDLERLFADYLTHLACRATESGLALTSESPLLVNLQRPPLLAALREGTVRDKTAALRKKGIGPADWTPHWFRHSHASALLLAGTPEWVVSRRLGHTPTCRPRSTSMAGFVRTRRCARLRTGRPTQAAGRSPMVSDSPRPVRLADGDDPIWRLWRELPPQWRGPVIGPGVPGWEDRHHRYDEHKLNLTGLPDPFGTELAWMAHWQETVDGTRPRFSRSTNWPSSCAWHNGAATRSRARSAPWTPIPRTGCSAGTTPPAGGGCLRLKLAAGYEPCSGSPGSR